MKKPTGKLVLHGRLPRLFLGKPYRLDRPWGDSEPVRCRLGGFHHLQHVGTRLHRTKRKVIFLFACIHKSHRTEWKKRVWHWRCSCRKPEGPYKPQPNNIEGVHGIDPNLFIDNDGQAYLYWSLGNIFVARLKENMLELDSEPQIVKELPEKGLKKGPYLFERNGIYYMTYPHVENKTERLEYATGDNPLGPFKFAGVIMDESPTGCWTNHHSIIEYNNQWYLFYHHNDYSPTFDKNRSIRADSLFFKADGTIQKVIPTLRGVGLTEASAKIQVDRYSQKSAEGAEIDLLDSLSTFKGWKTILSQNKAWMQYNAVGFGKKLKQVEIHARSEKGGTLEIRLDKADGPLLSKTEIPKAADWQTVQSKISKIKSGNHNLVVVLTGKNPVELDWIQFSK